MQERRADAPSRTVNEQPFTTPTTTDVKQVLVRRQIVDHQADCRHRVHARWHCNQLIRRETNVLAVAATHPVGPSAGHHHLT